MRKARCRTVARPYYGYRAHPHYGYRYGVVRPIVMAWRPSMATTLPRHSMRYGAYHHGAARYSVGPRMGGQHMMRHRY